jgi:hypothetical protein
MQFDHNFKNWADNLTQAILSSAYSDGQENEQRFLARKLKQATQAMQRASDQLHQTRDPHEFYVRLCVFIQEAKDCVYWYERSLEYEQVNLNNSQLILNQGRSMIDVLELALRVIKYQENP